MKKQLSLFAGVFMLTTININAQQNQNIIPCWTTEAQQQAFEANPALKQQFNLTQSILEQEYQQNLQNLSDPNKKTAITQYTVPVVFHILHQYGPENIDDQLCIDALAQINKDYAHLGSDTNTIYSSFKGLYSDVGIHFMLAHKDPNGNCTTGIIHHYDANTNWNQNSSSNYAYTGTTAGKWNPSKYLNVYIVKQIISSSSSSSGGIIVGYTYLPGSAPSTSADAIVYDYRFLSGTQARSLSHEIGHWFNLQHTFGSTNNPGVSCGDDGVSDTPKTKGYFSTCPGGNTGPFTGCSTEENMENFMDYSSCPKMFTAGQITKMRTAIASTTASRNNLWTTTNLGSSGTDVYSTSTCAPLADFYANKYQICAGQSVIFTDASSNGTVTSYSWTFQGGTPATSTSSAPSITFATPGTYSVSLTAGNSNGNNTKTKTSYVVVKDGTPSESVPYSQGFESGIPADWTVINNNAGSVTWAIANVGANGTSKSIYMNSASGNPAGHIDILESPILDFSFVTGATMSYYYAYARKSSTQNDTFKIQYSLDCGGTWSNLLTAADAISTMASNTGGTTSTAFTPTSTQWKQKTVSSSFTSALNNKPSVKLRFYFRNDVSTASANNLYIDEINLNAGNVGVNELESSIGLMLYPNPTNASSTIEFMFQSHMNSAKITVNDILGRTLESSEINAQNNDNIKYTINKSGNLSHGVYFVNVEIDGKKVTKKLIIE